MYERALPSVFSQTLPVSQIAIVVDHERKGAWETRNTAVKMATTEWIGFLDDDDELLPHHFQTLIQAAHDHNADVVWGWFKVVGGTDPFPGHKGKQWDITNPHIFPITCLVRRDLIVRSKAVFQADPHNSGAWETQDFPFWKSLHDIGAKFLALNEVTWKWYHHGTNTSGLGSRH